MHGNVWEMCWDWFKADFYRQSPAQDPRGPGHASDRVIRGESWAGDLKKVRSAERGFGPPGSPGKYKGFRLARLQSSATGLVDRKDDHPALLKAPFDDAAAKKAQLAWADHL